jgi:predicted TIM-barrel fold metal-dependent hydrolase
MERYQAIDCDGHVAEPFEMYREYIDPEFRERVPRRVDVEGHRWVIVDGQVYPNFVKYGGKPLGLLNTSSELPRPVQSESIAQGGGDPHRRIKDMDVEGIQAAVLYPSGTPSMCAVPDTRLEAALYRAYHRWLADYCAAYPKRLKGVAVVSMRNLELGIEELQRTAKEPWMVGVLCSPHMDDLNLDHPCFYPLWEAAQDLDLPICIHAGCGRPPYALGTNESSNNLFMMHTMAHPFEQMRAIAAVMGGGVLDKFPKLRFAFLEAGVGWVPWWLDRLAEHAEKLPNHVPLMKRHPQDYVVSSQCVFSCEPDEPMLEAVIAEIGDEVVLYASDYPHWDCSFPDSVRCLAQRETLSESARRNILAHNALKLYTHIGEL